MSEKGIIASLLSSHGRFFVATVASGLIAFQDLEQRVAFYRGDRVAI
jgi:hypothetical protein